MLLRTSADIGSAIASGRKLRKLSQAKLAKLAGTSQAVVSQIERGKETAHIGIVLALLAALELRIEISAADASGDPAPAPARADNVVIDEPLPDDSIDLDAIVGSGSKAAR